MKQQRYRIYKTSGFSLIELMVAILVGIILLGGMIQIFIMSRTSYRVQTSLNYMQENLRFASNQLNYSVRMSGFVHSVPDTSGGAVRLDGSMPAPSCGLTSWLSGMQGFDGAASGLPTGLTCLVAANYLPNTDVLAVTYAQPAYVYPDAVIAAVAGTSPVVSSQAIVPTGLYALVYDKLYFPRGIIEKAVFGNGTAIGTLAVRDGSLLASQTTALGQEYTLVNRSRLIRGAGMFPLAVDFYYVRRCSRISVVGGTCNANSDGLSPQPTLMRATLTAAGALVEQPIVESIEQMQIEYLASGCPNFLAASQLTAANWPTANCVGTPPANIWSRVIDVRITLLARSSALEVGYTDATPYNLSTDTAAYVPASVTFLPRNGAYRRKLMTITALPRNAVRPLPN